MDLRCCSGAVWCDLHSSSKHCRGRMEGNGGKWQQITIYCSVSSFKGVCKNEKHEQRNKCKEMLNS